MGGINCGLLVLMFIMFAILQSSTPPTLQECTSSRWLTWWNGGKCCLTSLFTAFIWKKFDSIYRNMNSTKGCKECFICILTKLSLNKQQMTIDYLHWCNLFCSWVSIIFNVYCTIILHLALHKSTFILAICRHSIRNYCMNSLLIKQF